jgi:DNA-directed RNA polymerase specialized sigma24 family protein
MTRAGSPFSGERTEEVTAVAPASVKYQAPGGRLLGSVSSKGEPMSKADVVVQHLPYLRRYARALTGNQVSGDAYVAATLEALLKEPELLEAPDLHRVTLFRLFSAVWNSLSVNNTSEPLTNDAAAERNLSQITPKPRQAFLLVSVEGFSEDHAARILDVDAPTLRLHLEESGRELAAQIATDVLIIEDEALIALDLQELVENLGHKVIGVARTQSEALAIGRKSAVGLILADIQLADGSSGLDAVNDLLNKFEVPVIFITAYPERFLTGKRPEPAFLVSKPYRPSALSAMVSQVLFFERNAIRRTGR